MLGSWSRAAQVLPTGSRKKFSVVFRPLTLALLALALIPASAAASSPTRILVQRDVGLSAAERADIRSDAGVKLVDTLPVPRTEVVTAPAGRAEEALAALRSDRDVTVAVREPVLQAFATLNDPLLPAQWAITNPDPLFSDADLDGAEAWDLVSGASVTVAVVDTGVQASHLDLGANLVQGDDYVDPDNDPEDEDGHGTHVSGIIAAVGNNNRGVAGLAYNASIMPLRVIGPDGADFADVAEAFDDAGDDGIRVVNASLGNTPGLSVSQAALLEQIFSDVADQHPNTLFVAAAGNSTSDNDVRPVYPCNTEADNVVCVGASNDHDELADFSNVGRRSVDLFAPGDAIASTYPTWLGSYAYSSGTSMASPQVAAIAALLLDADPTLTTAQVKQAILGSADQLADAELQSVTDARANANNALLWLDDVDFDNDLVLNTADNCWQAPNAGQENFDGDIRGDVCDGDDDGDRVADSFDNCPGYKGLPAYAGCAAPPPAQPPVTVIPTPTPPADGDGDGVYDVSDACRGTFARTKDGCPLPQVSALSATAKRKTVTVRVRTSREASVRITIERKKGKRWVRVSRTTRTTRRGRASLTVKRLRKGTHRVVVTVKNSSGSGTARSKSFRVR
jgi:subtilisin family serine protease